jgi:hypothetical protein
VRYIIGLVFLFSFQTFAEGQLRCIAETNLGQVNAILTMSEELQQITWWDHSHNRFQIAKFKTIDSDPMSTEQGYTGAHKFGDILSTKRF